MMRLITRPVARLLDAAQRRFRRARPGSVLIMVVSLLVLLALIGTAAMSTARVDRQSSRQHVTNVQIDLLADGLKQMVIGAVANDLYAPRIGAAIDCPTQDPSEVTPNPSEVHLGAPVPELRYFSGGNPAYPPTPPAPNIIPPDANAKDIYWGALPYPPFKSGSAWHFDPPNVASGSASYDLPSVKSTVVWRPTFITMGTPPVAYPALEPIDTVKPNAGKSLGGPFLAADTDGDGMPDSILFKLPVSPSDGVTWYGASRVVDHNSKINVNTAGDADAEYVQNVPIPSPGTGNVNFSIAGWFPSSVTLPGVIWSNELGFVNSRRFIGDTKNFYTVKVSDWQPNPNRNDYYHLTIGDALWHQLGRRLAYPGLTGVAGRYYGLGARPFSVSDNIALARRFILTDPSFQDSVIESQLPATTVGWVHSAPYIPVVKPPATTLSAAQIDDAVRLWYNDNFLFDFTSSSKRANARPFVTGYNPVNNFVRRHATDAAHQFGPRINWNDDGEWATKANLNTATFEELFQSFFDVMCDDVNANYTPFDDDAGWAVTDPYQGQKFDPKSPFTIDRNLPQHPARMFRSPVRGNGAGGPRLHPHQTMIMRAALAAANTRALRESTYADNAVPTSTRVTIQTGGGSQAYDVVMYGLHRQPFLTEVLLNNNPNKQPLKPTDPPGTQAQKNTSGYVAIELHNPYDVRISMAGYHLRRVNRSAAAVGARKLEPLVGSGAGGGGGGANFDMPQDVFIEPGGYLVLHNYQKGVTGDDDIAQYLPAGLKDADLVDGTNTIDNSKRTVRVVRGLTSIFEADGKSWELVITRDGDAVGGEMPIDSFDATGFTKVPPPTDDATPVGPVESWHYCRATLATGSNPRAWEFVYPGRYDGSLARTRHQGTKFETWDPRDPTKKDEPWAASPPSDPVITPGQPNDRNTRDGGPADRTNCSFPIPLCTPGMPGPFKQGNPYVSSPTRYAFPFGGFARTGDVMHVPYIGAYKIVPAGAAIDQCVEINAVTMDAVFAEDTDATDDFDNTTKLATEDVGRFAPLEAEWSLKPAYGTAINAVGTGTLIQDPNRFEIDGYFNGWDCIVYNADGTRQFRTVADFKARTNSKPAEITVDAGFNPSLSAGVGYRLEKKRYGWSRRLFDYFTTLASPGDDYEPQAPPGYSTAPAPLQNTAGAAVINRNGTPTEDNVPIEGLVNINTAPWKVIASLPLVMDPSTGKVDRVKTDLLAQAIVYFRDVDWNGTGTPWGPFKSVMELNAVLAGSGASPPGFANAMNTLPYGDGAMASDFNTSQGDLVPLSTTTPTSTKGIDLLRGNYEERYLNLTRVANLITLRSDVYTGYIMVQGWRDAGTANATLVAQRRLAFIVDRSRMSPSKTGRVRTPSVYIVPPP